MATNIPRKGWHESDSLAKFPVDDDIEFVVVLLHLAAHQNTAGLLNVCVVSKRHPRSTVVPGRRDSEH